MSEEMAGAPQDMHREAWWLRLMDDDLTADEREQWREHLAGCARCQRELAALAAADAALMMVSAAPPLPAAFTVATVARIAKKQRHHRLVTYAAGATITGLVTVVILTCLGSTYSVLERSIGAILSARHILFHSLVQTLLALLLGWKAILPYVVGVTLALYLALMPHGVLVTAVVLWLSRRRRLLVAGV